MKASSPIGVNLLSHVLLVLCVVASLGLPFFASASPFGGQARLVVPCYNEGAIYASLGAPIGGPYVWLPSTRTYLFGPPQYAGQWLLGLAGGPWYCLVSWKPVVTWAARSIYMMGSSGAGGGSNGRPGGSIYTPGPLSETDPTINSREPSLTGRHVVINEVFYAVDSAHGTSPANQFIEIYNNDTATVDLSGWHIQTSSSSSTIPVGTSLTPGSYLVIVASPATANYWTIPSTVRVVSVGATIGGGLSTPGDYIRLRNTSLMTVDGVSWGSNSTELSAPPAVVGSGHSLARISSTADTDTSSDWNDRVTPNPGR